MSDLLHIPTYTLETVSESLASIDFPFHFIALPVENLAKLKVYIPKKSEMNNHIDIENKEPFSINQNSLAGRVFIKKEHEVCGPEETLWKKDWIKFGAKTLIGVPISLNNHIFGVLTIILKKEINDINKQSKIIEKIKNYANTISLAILQMYYSEFLNNINEAIPNFMEGKTHEEKFYNEICNYVRKILNSEYAYIFIKVEENNSQLEEKPLINAINCLVEIIKTEKLKTSYIELYNKSYDVAGKFSDFLRRGYSINDLIKVVEIARITISEENDENFDMDIPIIELLEKAKANSCQLTIFLSEEGDDPKKQIGNNISRKSISNINISDCNLLTLKGYSSELSEIRWFPYLVLTGRELSDENIFIKREGLTARVGRTLEPILNCCPMENEPDNFSVSRRYFYENINAPCDSFVAVPLKQGNKLIGVLRTENRQSYDDNGCMVGGMFSDFQENFLWLISQTIAKTVSDYQNKVNYDSHVRDTLDTILDFLLGHDETHLYKNVVRVVSEHFAGPKCSLFMIDKYVGRLGKNNLNKALFFEIYEKLIDDGQINESFNRFVKAYPNDFLNDFYNDKVYLLQEVDNYNFNSNYRRTYVVNIEDDKDNVSRQSESLTVHVIKSEKAILCKNRDAIKCHPSWSGNRENTNSKGVYEDEDFTCNSVVAVPLKYNNETIGVLKIESGEQGKEFNNRDKTTLELFSKAIALAVKNVRGKSSSYDELFGIEILDQISTIDFRFENKQNKEPLNYAVYNHIVNFRDKVCGDIPAFSGESEIQHEIKVTIDLICQSLNLPQQLAELTDRFKDQEHVLYSIDDSVDLLRYQHCSNYSFWRFENCELAKQGNNLP